MAPFKVEINFSLQEKKILEKFFGKTVDKDFISTYNLIRTEMYRSGHNGAHSKCVSPPGHEGSNPSISAKQAHRLMKPVFLP